MQYFHVLRRVGPLNFLRSILREINEDQITTQAAALAYSWIFSIFPFLIFLLTLVAFVPMANQQSSIATVNDFIKRSLPSQGGQAIADAITGIMENRHSGLLSLGVALTLWSASSGVAMIMSALDRCYDIEKGRGYFRQRGAALLLTVIVILLIILILVLLPISGTVFVWIDRHSELLLKYYPFSRWPNLLSWPVKWAIHIARWSIAAILMLLMVGVVYRFGPRHQRRFQIFSPGAIFTVAVWVLLGLGFNFYVNTYGKYSLTYGPVGGIIIVLFSFYLDAVVLLIGAEINSEFDLAIFRHKGAVAE